VGGIIPAECRLILLGVIGLDGFGLDDDGGIAAGEGAAFGGDGAGVGIYIGNVLSQVSHITKPVIRFKKNINY
jgi:hypothetical protein